MEKHARLIDGFRQCFVTDSELVIFACGDGQQSGDATEFMRDVFGIDGKARITGVSVDFDETGRIGAVSGVDPQTNLPVLRPLRSSDWIHTPPR